MPLYIITAQTTINGASKGDVIALDEDEGKRRIAKMEVTPIGPEAGDAPEVLALLAHEEE